MSTVRSRPRNPHFDEGLVIWRDEYSGRYQAPALGYGEQFELQWKVAYEGNQSYFQDTGASTEDEYIDDRVYEWTGRHPKGKTRFHDSGGAARVLDRPLDPALIRDKECIDVCCGLGRWTRTMLALGAKSVMSIDMSQSGLANTGKYTPHTRRVDLMKLREEHPDLVGRFDFANFWGVAMCTHDPQLAFQNAASTVKPGGALYLMVYAPEGMHATKTVMSQRKHFHRLGTVKERLAYVEKLYRRRWDLASPLRENVKNQIKNLVRWPRPSKIGTLDMLEPFYNWVIPFDVVQGWFKRAGFVKTTFLNEYENPRCAYHVLGVKG